MIISGLSSPEPTSSLLQQEGIGRTIGVAPSEDGAGLYRVCKAGLRPASSHPVGATVGSQAETSSSTDLLGA